LGLVGRVPSGRGIDALWRGAGRGDLLLVRPGTGTVMAPGTARLRVGLWADCAGLSRFGHRLGVAVTAC